MKKNKRILVAGSEGYIGSALCKILYKKKIDFVGVDNNIYKGCELFKEKIKYNFIKKDVRDLSLSFLSQFDTFIHFPALTNSPVDDKNPKKLYDATRKYTYEIAKKCKKLNIKFIFPSSCSVYGKTNNKILNENSKLNPITLYSKNKKQIEKDLIKLSDDSFKPIILRISTLFGVSKKMRFDLALNMFLGMAITENIIKMNSEGTAWRPHVYLNDVVEAIIRSIYFDNKKLEIINVGSNDNNFQMITLAKKIRSLSPGLRIEFLKKYDPKNVFSDKLVKYGKDKRTYKVSFNKIHKIFKDYKTISVIDGLKKDYIHLKRIKLTKKTFLNTKYYRLQRISQLISMKKISNTSMRILRDI